MEIINTGNLDAGGPFISPEGQIDLNIQAPDDVVDVIDIHLQGLARGEGVSNCQFTLVGPTGEITKQGDAKTIRAGGFEFRD